MHGSWQGSVCVNLLPLRSGVKHSHMHMDVCVWVYTVRADLLMVENPDGSLALKLLLLQDALKVLHALV